MPSFVGLTSDFAPFGPDLLRIRINPEVKTNKVEAFLYASDEVFS